MDSKRTIRGFEELGDLSWGTHFCLFYQTEQDLLETLALYFRPGLVNHEYCLWITPYPSDEKALNELRQVIPSIDQHLEEGRIEIISCQQWYGENDEFDATRVLQAFETKLTQALDKGYRRIRVLGDEAWLDHERWEAFSDYESKLDERLAGKPISILCAYPTASHNAADILDIARTHRFIAAKRNGNWEILEAPELKRAKGESERLRAELGPQENEQNKPHSRQGLSQSAIFRYGVPILAVLLSLAGTFLLQPYVFRTPLFFLSIMISTWIGGIGPGLLAVVLSTLAINIFLSPAGLLQTQLQNIPNILSFLITALLVSSWSEKRRRAERALQEARDELEDQIRERTAEWNQANQALQAEIIEQKRTEEALRTDEYRLQAAIQAADIVLWERDLSSGQITWLGHHEKLLGFAPGELDDNTLTSFEERVHPEDIEELRRIRQRALEERSEYSHEYRVVWRDASIHWIRAQGRFIYNEAGQAVRLYGAVLDITERKRAQEQLQRAEEQARQVIDTIPQQIWSGPADGSIDFANDQWRTYIGLRLEELQGEGWQGMVHPDDKDRVMTAWRESVAKGTPYEQEERHRRADGVYRWFLSRALPLKDADGRVQRWYGTNTDIEERKQAEEALRMSEQVLREAESLGHTGSWEQNLVTGEIFNTEENLRLFFGDDRSKGVNFEDYAQVVHPDDREYVMQRREALLEEKGPSNIEYRVVWPDGSVHMIFGRATVVRDDLNRPIRVYGTNVDITERKQAEDEIKRQAARAETLARIAARLNQQLDLDAVIHAVCQEVVDTFKVSQSTMSLYDVKRDLLDYAGGVNVPAEYAVKLESIRRPQLDEFVRTMDSIVVVPDIQALPNVPNAEFSAQFDVRTVVTVDMRRNQQLIGVLALGVNGHVREFDQAELTLLKAISDQAAQAIANARLFQTVSEHASRMEALVEISRTFAKAGLDYQSILNTVARRTAEIIGDSCVITLFSDDAQRSFPVAFHHPDPKALSMMHEALMHTWQGGTDTQRYQTLLAGNSIYIPFVDPEEFRASLEPEFWTYFEAIGISSVLIVPLKTDGRVMGTLGVTRNRQGSPYTHDDQVLLQNIADRAAMSIQNARLFEQVQGAREQLEALSRRLLEVQEVERRALTTELHDRVGQNLTGLSIILQNLKASLPKEAARRLARNFDEAQASVEDTTSQIRDIMVELHLPELEDYGLAAALETYAERAASRGNLELIADLPDLAPPPLPSNARIALFRAAQEAISNVLKHADATQLEISLHGENGRVRLTIEDNGQGFDPRAAAQKDAPSWGLQIMRERIESVGGEVRIESEPGQGTRATFEIERPF